MAGNNSRRLLMNAYYFLKPYIPRSFQIFMRSKLALLKRRMYGDIWPIDKNSGKAPSGWTGWPDNKRFALVLTHDVERSGGRDKCEQLMRLELERGFRSSFNFVPGDYPVAGELRGKLTDNGFEVGVHGWTHDGSLYRSREIFLDQARRINERLNAWGSVGFRSPAMHHNLEWLRELDIEYDLSTFDTDPFEPQSDGMRTIFPFYVDANHVGKGYVELPYTLPQDFTTFILLKESSIRIWRDKLDWIAEKGGMALLNTHPDYMRFDGNKPGRDEYPASYYEDFLEYLKTRYDGQFWHVLPREMACFWKTSFAEREPS